MDTRSERLEKRVEDFKNQEALNLSDAYLGFVSEVKSFAAAEILHTDEGNKTREEVRTKLSDFQTLSGHSTSFATKADLSNEVVNPETKKAYTFDELKDEIRESGEKAFEKAKEIVGIFKGLASQKNNPAESAPELEAEAENESEADKNGEPLSPELEADKLHKQEEEEQKDAEHPTPQDN
jgi:hypothetical protein